MSSWVPSDDRLGPVVAEVASLDLMAHRHVSVDEESDAVAEVDFLPSRDLDSDSPGAMFAVMSDQSLNMWTKLK